LLSSAGEAKTVKNIAIGFVDVKDVALAHILAYEQPEAQGRYILSEGVYHHKDMVQLLHKMYPEYLVPTQYVSTALYSHIRPHL
jgi:cinnamoyl-CoA reductase